MIKAVFDMDMPECCAECDFEVASTFNEGLDIHWECLLTGEELEVNETREKRHDKCPLVDE